MYNNSLAFRDHKNGFEVAQMLLEENNVVMLSYEEDLLILNWEWTEGAQADRNYVVFMSCWEYEEEQDRLAEEVREYCKEELNENAKRVIDEVKEERKKIYEEELSCGDCIYYDDEVEDPMCETCRHNYPNNCVSK